MKFFSEVVITLKKGVRDPQGAAVDTILNRTGMEIDSNVSAGKYFTIEVTGDTPEVARQKLQNICNEVLSNPILENYDIRRFEQL